MCNTDKKNYFKENIQHGKDNYFDRTAYINTTGRLLKIGVLRR